MSYTLWSHGRLLGSTNLEFIYRENGHRTGWFRPEPNVQDILDVATGVSPALFAASQSDNLAEAYADVEAAGDRERALELELRDETGKVIATEDIGLRDTVFLMSAYGGDTDREDDAWYASLSDEERKANTWKGEPEPSAVEDLSEQRYQIQVTLVDHFAIP